MNKLSRSGHCNQENPKNRILENALLKNAIQWKLAVAVFALLVIASPALAQQAGVPDPKSTGAGIPQTDQNPDTAFQVRQNYHLRFPYAKAAFQADNLELVTAGDTSTWNQRTSYGNNGGGNTANGGRDPFTQAMGNITGSDADTGAGGDAQTALKRSQVQTTPEKILAYDLVVQPCGGIGHWLTGADLFAGPLPQEPMGLFNLKLPQYGGLDNPCYVQPKLYAKDTPLTKRDSELFHRMIVTFGVPLSDTQFQYIDRQDKQRFMELMFDPERFMWLSTNTLQMQGASAANALAGSAESAFNTSMQRVVQGDSGGGAGGGGGGGSQVGALINLANEASGVPTAADNPHKTVPQAVWMVMQMYKQCFIPLAILFLLPGAVMTQVKSQITSGFNLGEDGAPSPFEGIIRSIVAVFLIPATQVIVSYSIDVGNSMAYSCKDWVDLNTIYQWYHGLTYNSPVGQANNVIQPPTPNNNTTAGGGGGNTNQSTTTGGGGFLSSLGNLFSFIPGADGVFGSLADSFQSLNNVLGFGDNGDGLAADQQEANAKPEEELWLSQTMEVGFNMATYLFSTFVIILGAYQLILMCYLFLLGPLAAAFYAYPSTGAQTNQALFRGVFGNWLNAVITVALWRFYWMVILAIMTQRILYIQDNGGGMDLQWETAVFTCLLGLMFYVPFNPWSFDPAAAFEQASQAGGNMMGGGQVGSASNPPQGVAGAMGAASAAGGTPVGQVNQALSSVNQSSGQVGGLGSGWQAMDNSQSGSGGLPSLASTLGQQGQGSGGSGQQGSGSGQPAGTAAQSMSSPSPTDVQPPPSAEQPAAQTAAVAPLAAASSAGAGPPSAQPTASGDGGGGAGGGGGGGGGTPAEQKLAASGANNTHTADPPTAGLESKGTPDNPSVGVNPNFSDKPGQVGEAMADLKANYGGVANLDGPSGPPQSGPAIASAAPTGTAPPASGGGSGPTDGIASAAAVASMTGSASKDPEQPAGGPVEMTMNDKGPSGGNPGADSGPPPTENA